MKRAAGIILALILMLNLSGDVCASADTRLQNAYNCAADYYIKAAAPAYGSEWEVLGLCRGDAVLPEGWLDAYCASVTDIVKAARGVLSERKYTEYSRVILGLTAAGRNAADVGGCDLTLPLGDYDKTVYQGLNGPVWALIALDSGRYEMPENKSAAVRATRAMYVEYILSHELSGGGWAFSGSSADPDMTAMVLCALSKYKSMNGVQEAILRAVALISSMQNGDGTYTSGGTESSESCAQVVITLCELGISPGDGRFSKNGKTLIDNLLTYQLSDGSFEHVKGGGSNGTATEQALLALAAALRTDSGKVSLYRLVSFSDLKGIAERNKIEVLANEGLISGMGGGLFAPDKTMTRAEFCAIAVKALGLERKTTDKFSDVSESAWFSSYVGAAYGAGIIKGSSATTFTPDGTITDVEARIMLSRASMLLGLRDKADEDWQPSDICITRREVASQIYDLLKEARRV
ncbi:MAG: S-layer homology domain-containing protein [Oscillospiraceae bacterium]|nr:S-layer homology domain-containing protein [Oscillospiraceae bacterium]